MPDHGEALDADAIHQVDRVLRLHGEAAVPHAVGGEEPGRPEAAQPGGDGPVAGCIERRCDAVPGADVVGPAMQEQHGGCVRRPGGLVVDLQHAGGDLCDGGLIGHRPASMSAGGSAECGAALKPFAIASDLSEKCAHFSVRCIDAAPRRPASRRTGRTPSGSMVTAARRSRQSQAPHFSACRHRHARPGTTYWAYGSTSHHTADRHRRG